MMKVQGDFRDFLKWLHPGGIHWDGWIGFGVFPNLWAILPQFSQAVLSPEDPTVLPFFETLEVWQGRRHLLYVYIYICYINNMYMDIDIWPFSFIILIVWFGSEGKDMQSSWNYKDII